MFYPVKIAAILPLTEDAKHIELELTPSTFSFLNFKPGQHLIIRIPQLDVSIHRSYSISSVPGDNKLTIGVKKVKGGFISTYLCERIQVGDEIEIMAPQGNFVLPSSSIPVTKIIAFASGSGITPILSIIKSHLQQNTSHQVQLFYGNKTSKDVMYQDQLKQMVATYDYRFDLVQVFSQESTGMTDLEGRIDKAKIMRWKEYQFDPKTLAYYLVCGPGTMVEDVTQSLKELNIKTDYILNEYFTPPVIGTKSEKIENTFSVASIEIQTRKKWHTIELKNQFESVLDAGMRSGLDLPYSCKSGVCSTCQAKLLLGEVTMDNNFVLSESEIKQGFILTCQSHPMTPHVKLSYDF